MTFLIRQAQPSDAAGLAGLLISLGSFQHYFGSNPETVIQDRVGQHLNHCLADNSHSVYVAESSTGEIAGYVTVHWLPYLFMPGPEGYISELFIREPARGQGLGTQLLETVEKEAEARGCTRLALINIRSRESYQRGFYARRGWSERPDAAHFVYRLPKESS